MLAGRLNATKAAIRADKKSLHDVSAHKALNNRNSCQMQPKNSEK